MRRIPAKLVTTALATLAVGCTGIAAVSAQASPAASKRGTEHFTFMLTSTRTGVASVIATGLFTDGGTINVFSRRSSAEVRLGAGTIRLTTPSKGGPTSKTNQATCLTTITERSTYTLTGGSRRYAGIRGSGHVTVIDHVLSRHKPHGGCVTNRPPLAVQAIFTLSGSATLRK